MANLTPVSSFDDVFRLEVDTLALAGSGQPMNFQAQALLNRTEYLKDAADSAANNIDDLIEFDSDLGSSSDSSKGSSKIGYTPAGAGAVGRTVQAILRETVFLADYSSLAAAKTAAGNKSVFDPNGVIHKDVFNVDSAVFTEATDAAWKSAHVYRLAGSGTHSGVARIAHGVEFHPSGSGANGPSNADYGGSISVIKQDWFNTTQGGELDGQNITVRQGGRMGGGVQSDCAGTLYNVGNVHGSGWAAAIEAQTSTFNTGTAAVQLQVQTAMGILDSVTNTHYGFTAVANAGTLNAAYYAGLGASGTWSNFLQYLGAGNVELFKVDSLGRIVLRAASGSTPSKTIRAFGGGLNILNDAQNANIFSISDTGSMSIPGSADVTTAVIRGAAASAGAGTLVLGGTVSATASAGGGAALPATVLKYLIVNSEGVAGKIPMFAI